MLSCLPHPWDSRSSFFMSLCGYGVLKNLSYRGSAPSRRYALRPVSIIFIQGQLGKGGEKALGPVALPLPVPAASQSADPAGEEGARSPTVPCRPMPLPEACDILWPDVVCFPPPGARHDSEGHAGGMLPQACPPHRPCFLLNL